VEAKLEPALIDDLQRRLAALEADGRVEMRRQGIAEAQMETVRRVHLRYEGTDAPLIVTFGGPAEIVTAFEAAHRQRYGFIVPEKAQIVEAVSAEVIGRTETVQDSFFVGSDRKGPLAPRTTVRMWAGGGGRD